MMNNYKNKVWQNVLGVIVIAVFLFIAARNMTAFSQSFIKLIGG